MLDEKELALLIGIAAKEAIYLQDLYTEMCQKGFKKPNGDSPTLDEVRNTYELSENYYEIVNKLRILKLSNYHDPRTARNNPQEV